jgi:ParB family chromosome partitioning protein
VIQTVKLSKLRLSPINVRKQPPEKLKIPEMAADIAARGVLQNLLVTPAKKPKGTFEVFDGGRRLRGLLLLVENGTIVADDYDVPIKILQGDDATLSETSTAANFHQLNLMPAEECRAFQLFIGNTGTIDAVANRLGVTRRFVEGRLRLASLAEPTFDALSSEVITLDVAKAYASTENQEKQLRVWNSYQTNYVTADTIRRVIANETLNAKDPIAILVGEDRYIEAGGRVDRDLFTDGSDKWVNPEIAHRLAGEVMEAEAKRIGENLGLAWIRPIASNYAHNAAQGLYRVVLDQPGLTDAQGMRLGEIEERRTAIEAAMQDEGLSEDAFKLLDAEDDRLIGEAQTIEDRAPVLPDDLKPHVGVFLLLTPQGKMLLDPRYYSEQPIRREDPPSGNEGDETDDEAGGDRFAGGFRIGGDQTSAPERRPEAVGPGGKPLSARLFDELAMQRRDILASCLLAQPALALDYALFAMIDARTVTTSYNYVSVKYGTTIRATGPQDPVTSEVPGSRARAYLAEAHDGFDAAWTEHRSEVDRFEAFRALDDDNKANWLAYIVAMSLEAKPGIIKEQIPIHNRLASILEIDVATWWRPTSENFFDCVNKGTILSLLHDVGGGALSARHATLQKTEISEICQKLFAGDSIVEPEVNLAALAWVPNAMRFRDSEPDALGKVDNKDLAPADDDDLDESGTARGDVEATFDPGDTSGVREAIDA